MPDQPALNVVPWPQSIEVTNEGRFAFSHDTQVALESPGAEGAANYLRSHLPCGFDKPASSAIRFKTAHNDLGAEGYTLDVTPHEIVIAATHPAGFFYAAATLIQLAPTETAPLVRIKDHPRFTWRGLMLDVCRHVMPVDGICRLLDCMSWFKLNVFHLHLTDDQAWRIAIDRYPKLQEISAWRAGEDGLLDPSQDAPPRPRAGTYGGFYTRDDIRRIVKHAAERHIMVIPEIEMPGHAMAAIAAYPELSCTGGPFEVPTRAGIFKDVYCAGNEQTFAFLEGVMDEILPLFPGRFVHVGGDECPKDRWQACDKCQARIKAEGLADEHELQSYVIRRMQKFLASRGKQLIGWDEILEGGLAPGAAVMSWRGVEGGIAAAQAGHDAVMTPHTHVYLDYRQAPAGEPKAMGERVTTLATCYEYDPIPEGFTPEQAKHILGVQANVWTEFMPDMAHVEYMTWPRAAAVAERAWSSANVRDIEHLRKRLLANERRFTTAHINARRID